MDSKKAIKQLKALEKKGGVMRLAAEGWKGEWQVLIAILMSARTRDEVTIVVAEKLFAQYPTVEALAKAREEDVAAIVKSINFFRNKTKSVVGCAKALVAEHKGVPPKTLEELIELPGVGRKTANVYLSEMGNDAIGVDTHVAYISRKLGWTKHTDPHKIEQDLQKLFPQKYWSELNTTLVHFGKTHLSRRKKDLLLEQVKNV